LAVTKRIKSEMEEWNEYINLSPDKASEKVVNKSFEDNLLLNSEDSDLFGTIGKYMRARLDLEDVRNDPGLSGMDGIVKEMISDYNKNRFRNGNNEKFIRDIFASESYDEKIIEEIRNIKLEISNSEIDDISAEWVKEWHQKRQMMNVGDTRTEEIRDFITSSLESEKIEPGINVPNDLKKNGLSRSLMVRYISFSAAAVLGTFILIKALLPSYDSDKLFNSYYEPLKTISSVTRGVNSDNDVDCASAIDRYKVADYQTAAVGFSSSMKKDPYAIRPRFFMGITQVALGNYYKAIELLSDIAGSSVEYGKEARWYLGLAYIKTGEKEKASACFEILKQTSGFYSEQAEKILQRLK
jgi:hypothetical protein